MATFYKSNRSGGFQGQKDSDALRGERNSLRDLQSKKSSANFLHIDMKQMGGESGILTSNAVKELNQLYNIQGKEMATFHQSSYSLSPSHT